jgi:hypothetical protein
MSDYIHAERNGIRQSFTRKSWDVLGTDKLGWVELAPTPPPVPKEVEPALTRQTTEVELQPKKRGRK